MKAEKKVDKRGATMESKGQPLGVLAEGKWVAQRVDLWVHRTGLWLAAY
jgi:hypothetical protein